MSSHPVATHGLQRKLAQGEGGRSFGQMVAQSGANESSVSPFPCNLAGSCTSFPPNLVKSPKSQCLSAYYIIPRGQQVLYRIFPSLLVAYLVCFSHNCQWHQPIVVASPLRRHQRTTLSGRLHRGGGATPGVVWCEWRSCWVCMEHTPHTLSP